MRANMPALSALLVLVSIPGTSQAKKGPEAELAKALEGRVAEAPVRCIDVRSAYGMKIIGTTTVVARSQSGLTYRNDPAGGCPAQKVGLLLVTNLNYAKLCEGDVVGLVHSETGDQKGACRLGKWTPYRRAP